MPEMENRLEKIADQALRSYQKHRTSEPSSNESGMTSWPRGSGDISAYLNTQPSEIQWFCQERLLSDRAHLLTGIGGSSKTRLLYHLAIGAVIGRLPWNWAIRRTGNAILFLAEDSPGNVHRSLSAIKNYSDLSQTELELVAKRLKIFPLAGQDTKLLRLVPGIGLTTTSHVDALIQICRELGNVVFVGLDPAIALSEGDESNQSHQRRIGELADQIAIKLNACVVLTSHAAKILQSTDEVVSHSSRGGGAITDAVRAEYVLRGMTAPEAKRLGISDMEGRKAHVQLVATKGNELPPNAYSPTWLIRGQEGVLSETKFSESIISSSSLGKRELTALAILNELSKNKSPTVRDWTKECVAQKLLSGSPASIEKSIHRIKNSLIFNGRIEPGAGRGVFVPVIPSDGDVENS